MAKRIDMTGGRYGRYTVIGLSDRYYGPHRLWLCRCDCGQEKAVAGHALRRGEVVSCGCHRDDLASARSLTHGESGSAWRDERSVEYRAWANMLHRCGPNASGHDRINYYTRGIRVCERWRSYENFLADMGRKPSPLHEIDRRDNDGMYEPSNCRWVLREFQSVNKRTNDVVDYHGQRLAFTRAWEMSSRVVSYSTAHSRRWKHGWPAELAIDTPVLRLSGKRPAGSSYPTQGAA